MCYAILVCYRIYQLHAVIADMMWFEAVNDKVVVFSLKFLGVALGAVMKSILWIICYV